MEGPITVLKVKEDAYKNAVFLLDRLDGSKKDSYHELSGKQQELL